MASRSIPTLLMRMGTQYITRYPRKRFPVSLLSPHHTGACHTQRSRSTTSNSKSTVATIKSYNYSDIEKQLDAPSPKRILIDSREPEELHLSGTIPGSLNIPLISAPDAFSLSADEFKDRFGFDRPGKDVELIFFCRAGVRSLKAANLALEAGWSFVGDYNGSWLDWEKHGGRKLTIQPS